MDKRLLMFGLIFLSAPQFSNAQALLPDDYHGVKIVPSPTASSISKYQEIPVDLFTGTPSISVPLTSIEYGGIKVPVTLSYHSTGIKVSERPGWAGLGWDVITGGQITRKVNWIPDEFYNRHPNYGSQLIDKGYYFLGNMLNTPDWTTPDKIKAYAQIDASGGLDPTLPPLSDGEPDEFNFNFAGYSGLFYLSETGQWQVKSKDNIQFEIQSQIDTSANYTLYRDFDAISGAYIDSTIALTTGNYEAVSSLFTKFTIITPDGYRYEFGGSKSAIEFSRGSIANVGAAGLGLGPYEDRRNNITANTWNLTKITTPLGESISFNYQRGRVIFTENRYFSLSYYLQSSNNPNTGGGNGGDEISFGASSTNPSFLASIETQTKKIEFVRSQAIELPQEAIPLNLLPQGESAVQFVQPFSYNWKDLSYSFTGSYTSQFKNNNQQLDSIKVFDKLTNSYVNGIKFFQRANAAKRRTLDSIAFFDPNNNIQKYSFQYSHVDDLPFYESLRRDHWGYFNGGTEPPGPSGWPDRTSNTLAAYGMINKIIYPTGGETDFEFEPGYYGNTVHVDPNNAQPISLVPSTGGSAGVRIKSLTSNANNGSPALTTQYYYTNSFATGGNSPSGVLSSEPRYVDDIQFDNGIMTGLSAPCGGHFYLENKTDDNSEWMGQAKGGLVTYSEVTTRNADGSFVTTKYTNNNNALYQDELGLYYNYGGVTTAQSNYRLTSNDLERGKLLSQASYNSSGTKVKELLYTYVNDPARKNLFTKCFAKKNLFGSASGNAICAGQGLGGGARFWVYKIYSYQNPIKTLAETTYENGQLITETKTFSYDTYGNVTRTVSSRSDNDVQVEDVQYNVSNNFQGTAVSSYAIRLKNLLSNYRIKNYPVERTTTLRQAVNPAVGSDRIVSGTLYEYDNALPLLSRIQAMELSVPYYPQTYTGGGGGGITNNYLPASINTSGNFVYDSKYKPQVSIYNYSLNITGNQLSQPLAVSKKSGDEAYTWDYGLSYLSSFTTNCRATQAAFTSFEGSYLGNGANDDNNGNWKFYNDYIINDAFTGKKCIRFSADNPQQVLTSIFSIPLNKVYTLSFWYKDKFPTIKQGTQTLGQTFTSSDNNWKYYELAITGNGSPVTLSIGLPVPNFPTSLDITYLDEVRLYPQGSTMKSYTYNSNFGLPSSIDDESGKINFFEYDSFGHMTSAKDKDGNIISSNSYQYQGPQ